MKLTQKSTHGTEASALLATMIFIVILAMSIGGYMSYVSQQARMASHSQAWNLSMAIAEAGVEEALEHLNTDGTNNPTANGWTSLGNYTYEMQRTVTGGSFNATYTVTLNISNANEPSIMSSGYVTPPAAASVTTPFFFATANVSTPTSTSSKSSVARGVSAVVYRPLYFQTALAAKGSIDMNGNGVTVDSFDSALGMYGGTNIGDQGTVASDGGVTNSSVSLGNANIFGPLYYNPSEPTPTVGPNGAVGTHSWQAGHSGFETGFLFDTANFTFPDTTAPYTSGTAPLAGTVPVLISSNLVGFTNLNQTSPPGGLTNPETLGWVTTNLSTFTVGTYPGSEPDLVTNSSWVTVGTYPGPEPSLVTNTTPIFGASSPPTPGDFEGNINTNTTSVSGASSTPSAGSYLGAIGTNNITTYTTNIVTTGHGHNAVTTTNITSTVTHTYNYASISGYSYTEITGYTYKNFTYTYTIPTYSYAVYTTALTYTNTSYDAVLTDGNSYYAASLGNTIVTGHATLVMPNGYNIGNLTLAPGAQLIVYIGGNSFSLDGNTVVNQPGLAQSLIILCEPSVTSIALSGNAGLTAVVVAPNANVQLNGGGNNHFDFMGSLMADNITLNGHWNFHYDVQLSHVPISLRYILKSWNEVTPTQASN